MEELNEINEIPEENAIENDELTLEEVKDIVKNKAKSKINEQMKNDLLEVTIGEEMLTIKNHELLKHDLLNKKIMLDVGGIDSVPITFVEGVYDINCDGILDIMKEIIKVEAETQVNITIEEELIDQMESKEELQAYCDMFEIGVEVL